MRFVSYLIITAIASVVGYSSLNSIDLINQKEVVVFENTVANLNLEDRYLLEPVFNVLFADLNS